MSELVKVRLLNNGGYGGMDNVEFPVIVNVQLKNTWGAYALVPAWELERIGCDMNKFKANSHHSATGIKNWSLLKEDFEIIND